MSIEKNGSYEKSPYIINSRVHYCIVFYQPTKNLLPNGQNGQWTFWTLHRKITRKRATFVLLVLRRERDSCSGKRLRRLRPLGVLIHFSQTQTSNLRVARLAEREGFEPPAPLSAPVFKTGVIDHSTISPYSWHCLGLKADAKVVLSFETCKFLFDFFVSYYVLAEKRNKILCSALDFP